MKFLSIVRSYTAIKNMNNDSTSDESVRKINDVKDIRKIYDSITAEGVAEENLPDGELFRKGVVYIQGKKELCTMGYLMLIIQSLL